MGGHPLVAALLQVFLNDLRTFQFPILPALNAGPRGKSCLSFGRSLSGRSSPFLPKFAAATAKHWIGRYSRPLDLTRGSLRRSTEGLTELVQEKIHLGRLRSKTEDADTIGSRQKQVAEAV